MENADSQIWFAQRKYYLDGDSQDAVELTVRFKRPEQNIDHPLTYKCECEIQTKQRIRVPYVRGVDEVSAIVMILAMAGSWINGLNETEFQGRLRWVGGEVGDLGLPTIEDHWPFSKNRCREGPEAAGTPSEPKP
jgi:hypothetical protein